MGQGLAEQLGVALAGGLLSSSCCVLQLALNTLSVGCAGFGALTPWRPHFVALTAASLAFTHARYRDRRRTALAAALALALAGTPELVKAYNLGSSQPSGGEGSVVQVSVQGMKCQACAARLRQAVQAGLAKEPTATCSVDFAAGKVRVYNSSSLGGDALLAIVRTQGFQGSLDSPGRLGFTGTPLTPDHHAPVRAPA